MAQLATDWGFSNLYSRRAMDLQTQYYCICNCKMSLRRSITEQKWIYAQSLSQLGGLINMEENRCRLVHLEPGWRPAFLQDHSQSKLLCSILALTRKSQTPMGGMGTASTIVELVVPLFRSAMNACRTG